MSAFSLLHGEDGEEEGRDHAENADEYYDHHEGEFAEHVNDQDYDENTYNEHEGDYTDTGPENGDQARTEEHPDPDQDEDPAYDFQDYAEGEDYDQDFGETIDDPNALAGQPADQPYEDDTDGANLVETAQSESQLGVNAAETQPEDQNTTKARPTTLHDNTTSKGEYNKDDLIDWDEGSLTSDHSEQTATGQLDDTTLNMEYDDAAFPQGHGDQHEADGEDFLNEKVDNQEDYQHYYDDGQPDEGHEQPQFADSSFAQPEYGDDQAVDRRDDAYTGHDFDEPAGGGVEGDGQQADFIAGLEEVTGEHYEEEEFDDTVIINRPEESAEEWPQDSEQQPNDTFDDINFDEDDEADGEQLFDPEEQAAEPTPVKATSNGSPLGKRSFDDFDEPEDELAETPEIKKVRSR